MKKALILSILIVAFLLRFISLAKYPVGFNADEASFGYDAYSILHTGRDQWGSFMPMVLKSFGDYKSPLYAYITIPSVAVLGLNEFATRLPNVIVGTLAVFAAYLLASTIGGSKNGRYLGLITAFLLAVNPWAIMMSRGAFEANLVTFFIPIGIYFFLKGLTETRSFVWAALFLGLSLFTYHSATLITPILIVSLVVIFWEKFKSIGLKKILVPLLILFVFIMLAIYSFTAGGGTRVSERSITQGALEEGAQEKISQIAAGVNPNLAKILHNKYQVVLVRFIDNYQQYFSFKFLISQGTQDSYYGMFPGIGVIYIVDAVLILGLIPFCLMKNEKKLFIFIVFWLLVAPLPAALSTGSGYSGNRAEGMLPALQILEAFGFMGWIGLLTKYNKKILYLFLPLMGFLLIWNFVNFVKLYTTNIPQSSYTQMLDGNLTAASWIYQNKRGKGVIVSRSFSEPQIFFAFATIWDPVSYQSYTKSWNLIGANVPWVDQLPEYNLGNLTVKSVDWKKDTIKGSVIVGRPEDFPEGLKPDKIFYYANGQPALYVKNY